MPKYSVTINCRLTEGDNKKLTAEELDHRTWTVDRLVQELAASEIAEPEMVARPKTGKVEIVGVVDEKTRARALDKVMKWEMAMENMLKVDMMATVEETAEMEVLRVDSDS